jgi:hypothetical protein
MSNLRCTAMHLRQEHFSNKRNNQIKTYASNSPSLLERGLGGEVFQELIPLSAISFFVSLEKDETKKGYRFYRG